MNKPCSQCPYKRSTPPGQFPAQRYEQLRDTVGWPGAEVPIGGPVFACHMSAEGCDKACAGWLAVCGARHLGMRVKVLDGQLPAAALRRRPELFDSYDEMAERQAGHGA